MARFRCTVCNYIYDEEKEGKKFRELPQSWICPICSAPKSAFEEIGREEKVVEKVEFTYHNSCRQDNRAACSCRRKICF
ncbi:MAG: rubredoxin, partial [Candidatus Methanoperedens sp.]